MTTENRYKVERNMSKSRLLEMDGGYLGVLSYHQKVRVRIRVWVGVRVTGSFWQELSKPPRSLKHMQSQEHVAREEAIPFLGHPQLLTGD